MRVMAIDYGDARTGIAVSDALGMIAGETFVIAEWDAAALAKAVRKVFGLKPAEIIKQLNLLRPIYSKTNQYGHFGRKAGDPDFELSTWERDDKTAALRAALAE